MAAALLVPARLLPRRKRIAAGEDAIKQNKMTQAHFVFLLQVDQVAETLPKVAALSFERGRKRDGL